MDKATFHVGVGTSAPCPALKLEKRVAFTLSLGFREDRMKSFIAVAIQALLAVAGLSSDASAQVSPPQIPTLQQCSRAKIETFGTAPARVVVTVRPGTSGDVSAASFELKVVVACEPSKFPTGNLLIAAGNYQYSTASSIESTSIEQVAVAGREAAVAWISGRCNAKMKASSVGQSQCRFWVQVADNQPNQGQGSAPQHSRGFDTATVLVLALDGQVIMHGSGIVDRGGILVAP
jgi:hypothetical protein